MNVFGAFTFGALIKTFLPGFVWLVALVIAEADLSQAFGKEPQIWTFAQDKDQLAVVLAIPASILLGLLSNVIVFMGVNDRLVRVPVRKAYSKLFALYDDLAARLRDRCWTAIGCADQDLKTAFNDNIDVELIMLHSIGTTTLAYIREQYWFHLEFQMNLLLSIWALAFACAASVGLNAPSYQYALALLLAIAAVGGAGTWFLLFAARKNYCRHVAKMASMMASVLCPPAKEAGQTPVR
jgi:hypothetical protein